MNPLSATLAPGAPPSGSVVVLAGRYRLGQLLGQGASGRVHVARDEVTGTDVAVKLLNPRTAASRARLRRELAALRLLRIPGIAQLLDYGSDGDLHFLVLPLVIGTPFPGVLDPAPPDERWEALRPRLVALLSVLREVHAHGVVHRDLKPANVIVGEDGVPVLLDFGVARGEILGPPVTREGGLVGTPRYLAPEQIGAGPVDARADLYAVGVMVYEALSGHAPHEGDGGLEAWLARRATEPAMPLALRARGLDDHVATLVDRLLARDPAERPASAAEVLRALDARAPTVALPPLGDLDRPARVAARLLTGPVALWGPGGTGKTWLADRVAAACEAAGRHVLRPRPADVPLGSLAGIAETADPRAAEASLRALLDTGAVVVADDCSRLDRFSRRLLASLAESGAAILRVADLPGAERTAPLSAEDLRVLFVGPDRLLHLGEDAAAELHARTDGVLARVSVEVRGWVATGLARWVDGRLKLDLEALRTLQAGLYASHVPRSVGATRHVDAGLQELLGACVLSGRAAEPDLLARCTARPAWQVTAELEELQELGLISLCGGSVRLDAPARGMAGWDAGRWGRLARRVADALPHGEHRLRLLVDAEALDDAVAEAGIVAASLADDGQVSRAIGILAYAWELVREVASVGADARLRILGTWTALALSEGTSPVLAWVERALSEELDRTVGPLRDLVAVARLLAGGGEPAAIARQAEEIPSFVDERLEAHRRLLPARAILGTDLEGGEARVLAVLNDPAASDGLRRRASGWLGMVRYRQGRFAEAAALHLANADVVPHRRLRSRLNAGAALLEVPDLPKARLLLEEVADEARKRRFTSFEAHAEVLLRSVAYREARASEPDLALLEALDHLGIPSLSAFATITEAAVAWRAGSLEIARALAHRASGVAERARLKNAGLLAWALGRAAGTPAGADESRMWLDRASSSHAPRLAAQAATLVAGCQATDAAAWRAVATTHARTAAVPAGAALEVLTGAELLT